MTKSKKFLNHRPLKRNLKHFICSFNKTSSGTTVNRIVHQRDDNPLCVCVKTIWMIYLCYIYYRGVARSYQYERFQLSRELITCLPGCQEQRMMQIKLSKPAWILGQCGRESHFGKPWVTLILKAPFNSTASISK